MQVTFKGKPVTLVGQLPKLGDKIRVKGTSPDFSPYKLKAKKRPTIVSTFPSINTSVCDEQTSRIVRMANENPRINFISLSLDLPTAQRAWCAAKGFANVQIASDYAKRSFSKKYGLLIDDLKLMARSLMVLNGDGELVFLDVCSEVANLPNFDGALAAAKKAASAKAS